MVPAYIRALVYPSVVSTGTGLTDKIQSSKDFTSISVSAVTANAYMLDIAHLCLLSSFPYLL